VLTFNKLVHGFDPDPEWTLGFYFTHASWTQPLSVVVANGWAIPAAKYQRARDTAGESPWQDRMIKEKLLFDQQPAD
jgi:hypothetical protein